MQTGPSIPNSGPSGRLSQRPPLSEMFVHPLRTLHTVRHLRPSQIAYQALRRIQQVATADQAALEAPMLLSRGPVPQASALTAGFDGRTFCFLNRRLTWEGPDRWHPRGVDDLWMFNLHYFKFLERTDADLASRLLLDWMMCNRDSKSAAWHPYPISLRVREWIEWLHAHVDAPSALRDQMRASIAAQTAALMGRLEFNVLGNHLLENAITLCWAGASFAGVRADEWLETGQLLLERELHSQLCADGSHEERSPMYQAQLAEAVLRLADVASQSPKPAATSVASLARAAGLHMIAALTPMVHPDGDYALMHDTALGVAPTLASLIARFAATAPAANSGTWALGDAGFAGNRTRDGRYFIFDVGPIGPDHQPGHGHAGALSFELSAGRRRIVTDTGVLTYAAGAARQHDRSTAAHNTIEIDDRDQSEVWGAFRCARRSSIVEARTERDREGVTFTGSYRGPGKRGAVFHRRQVVTAGRMLAFSDTVIAEGGHRAALRLHLAPGLQVTANDQLCRITDEHRRPIATLAGDGFGWTASSSPYHPEFGVEIARPCLTAALAFRDRLAAKWWLILN